MRKVNILEFRKEVLAILDANRKKVKSLETKKDNSIITFKGNNYTCEVTLNDKWIGYDLDIEVPAKCVLCGLRNDTDIYPIYGEYEDISLEIYDDLLTTIKAIFTNDVHYISNDKFSYTARRNDDGSYTMKYWERKKFLFFSYATGWSNGGYSKGEFDKIKMSTLS